MSVFSCVLTTTCPVLRSCADYSWMSQQTFGVKKNHQVTCVRPFRILVEWLNRFVSWCLIMKEVEMQKHCLSTPRCSIWPSNQLIHIHWSLPLSLTSHKLSRHFFAFSSCRILLGKAVTFPSTKQWNVHCISFKVGCKGSYHVGQTKCTGSLLKYQKSSVRSHWKQILSDEMWCDNCKLLNLATVLRKTCHKTCQIFLNVKVYIGPKNWKFPGDMQHEGS